MRRKHPDPELAEPETTAQQAAAAQQAARHALTEVMAVTERRYDSVVQPGDRAE